MLPRPRRLAAPLAAAGALGILLAAGSARAQVFVTSTATFTGSAFHYAYTVTNVSPDDLFVVNLNGLPAVQGALFNFSAPDGFTMTSPYDYNVGIESFEANSSFTSGSTTSGFSFDSTFAPSTVAFDTVSGAATPYTGTTLGPAGAPVPEASTLVSLGMGLSVLAFAIVRRRRAAAAHS